MPTKQSSAFFLLDICQIHFTILICTINIKCLQKRGRKYLVQPFNNLMLEYTFIHMKVSKGLLFNAKIEVGDYKAISWLRTSYKLHYDEKGIMSALYQTSMNS